MCKTQSLEHTLPNPVTSPSSTALARTSNNSNTAIDDEDDNADDDDDDDDDDDEMPLAAEDKDNAIRMMGLLFEKTELVDSRSDEEEDLILLDALDAAAHTYDDIDPVHSSAEGFIEYFARINIIKTTAASRLNDATFQQQAGNWASIGNSRDMPTRFIHYCPNKQLGCRYSNPSTRSIRRHAIKCKIAQRSPVLTKTFTCTRSDCSRQFTTKQQRRQHERDHDFERRQCDLCQAGRWYETEYAWSRHRRESHTNFWDPATTCSVPDCPRGRMPFPTRGSYLQHLRNTHQLSGPDVARYLPPLPNKAPVWGSRKRKCPFDGCTREIVQKTSMRSHLMSMSHKMSSEEAAAKIEEMMVE